MVWEIGLWNHTKDKPIMLILWLFPFSFSIIFSQFAFIRQQAIDHFNQLRWRPLVHFYVGLGLYADSRLFSKIIASAEKRVVF